MYGKIGEGRFWYKKSPPPPVELAYWRVRHPHKLYITGCGMKNEDVIWVLEICPTPWGGVGGKNVTFL